MTTTAAIFVDMRERAVADALAADGVAFETHALAVGDFEVKTPEASVLIERKTRDDYAASIKDGRLRDQRARATAFAAAHPHVRFLYIFESTRPPSFVSTERIGGRPGDGDPKRGVAERSVAASLARTTLRDGIGVLHSASPRETAALLQLIARHLESGEAPSGDAPAVPTRGAKRPRDALAVHPPVVAALQCITGVSVAAAGELVALFPTARALVEADADALAAVWTSQRRRLGPVLAERVKAMFC